MLLAVVLNLRKDAVFPVWARPSGSDVAIENGAVVSVPFS